MQQSRLIMYHKHPASALVRFARMPHGGVSAFAALPVPSQLMDAAPQGMVATHPAQLLNQIESQLGLQTDSLEVDSDFHAWVDVAGGPIEVYLVRFTQIDPPIAQLEKLGGEFINLTQARNLVPAELEMLRMAYECVMEG